jgi:two-component system alkaline phosphatase synthesis response regulator PhoP
MGKRKILIIEDDRDIVEMLEYNLQEEGYKTVSALNGEKGIALAGKERPDLIILDIMLPIMDGFEVCRTLKNDDRVACRPGRPRSGDRPFCPSAFTRPAGDTDHL